MAINSINLYRSRQTIHYKTPTSIYLQRLALKLIELWRSISNTFSGLMYVNSSKIQKGSLLSTTDIIINTQNINNLGRIDNIKKLSKNELSSKIAQNSEKNLIFFPYIITNFFRNHIVFFAVNKQKEEIIFYDSKGYTIADYKLEDIYRKLESKFPIYRLVQNTKKEQYDSFNCGVYVIEKIKQIAKKQNKSFQEILDHSNISYRNAMQARKSLISYEISHEIDRSQDII